MLDFGKLVCKLLSKTSTYLNFKFALILQGFQNLEGLHLAK